MYDKILVILNKLDNICTQLKYIHKTYSHILNSFIFFNNVFVILLFHFYFFKVSSL